MPPPPLPPPPQPLPQPEASQSQHRPRPPAVSRRRTSIRGTDVCDARGPSACALRTLLHLTATFSHSARSPSPPACALREARRRQLPAHAVHAKQCLQSHGFAFVPRFGVEFGREYVRGMAPWIHSRRLTPELKQTIAGERRGGAHKKLPGCRCFSPAFARTHSLSGPLLCASVRQATSRKS